ncbi:MAG: methylmalonyl-CoA epimerase, partial [Candidatus Eisenbacteria bacterium]|nr:methylmalonyl-CoA epimerase [Candidatus Eisenbacteria bacterium]
QQLDHLGIAVADIDAALRLYRDVLGLELVGTEEVPDQKVRAYHLRLGESEIELLAPTDPEGPVGKFLAKRGPGIHHIALRVDDVAAAAETLAAAGYRLIGRPSTGAGGKTILFLHPSATGGVLLELCAITRKA